jgi:chemotaxis protein MotA
MLETENHSREEYDEIPAKVWDAAGGYAPTIGILGAVLGLIQIMQHLSDPSRLGQGIAVAFVATIYGVGSANLIFLPAATKLQMKARHESRRRELMLEAVLAIQEGLNPQMIQEKLDGFAVQTEPLPAADRRAA